MTRHPKPKFTPTPFALPWAPLFNGPVAESMMRSTETFTKGMEAIQGETSHFISERLREDARTLRDCTECETLEGLLSIQAKWVSDANAAYMAEAGKLMDLGQRMFNGTAEP